MIWIQFFHFLVDSFFVDVSMYVNVIIYSIPVFSCYLYKLVLYMCFGYKLLNMDSLLYSTLEMCEMFGKHILGIYKVTRISDCYLIISGLLKC
jgi:hypothetical protein